MAEQSSENGDIEEQLDMKIISIVIHGDPTCEREEKPDISIDSDLDKQTTLWWLRIAEDHVLYGDWMGEDDEGGEDA